MESSAQMDGTTKASGTVLLEEKIGTKNSIVLHPTPSDDPNDPLNWSTLRKTVNFGISCTYVTLTFVLLDNIYVTYEPFAEELSVTFAIYNQSIASNYAGLAIGSLLFIPFVHRYGRRPLYLASTLIQVVVAIWSAYMRSSGEVIANQLVGGLGGALSETIAVITIGDLFFVHHHALMNGIFLFMQSVGAFVGPVIAGYAVTNLGWRWMWKITTILIAANFLLSLFFFEESKYIPHYSGLPVQHGDLAKDGDEAGSVNEAVSTKDVKNNTEAPSRSMTATELTFRPRPYRHRMALVTPTEEPLLRHIYQPVLIFFRIPGVLYCALSYGTMLAWISMMSTAMSVYPSLPPYSYSPSQIGLLQLGPFVGLTIGTVVFSPLSDWSILVLSKRNNGIFEPEMRLWLALPGSVLCFIGLLTFGYTLGDGRSIMSVLVGYAIYCLGFVICADVSLTYVLDCYQEIIGDSMVIIVFCRNIISVVMLFIYTPWINHVGIKNTFLIVAFLCITVLLSLTILLLCIGKKLRIRSVPALEKYAAQQISRRRQ